MKKLIVAKSAGFCFGVSRSVKMAEELLETSEMPCYSLGELIHNGFVVEALREKGLYMAQSPQEIPEGAKVLIRSHGASRFEFEQLEQKGAVICDATCPKVSHIHGLVAKAEGEGRLPVIMGKEAHPEIQAIQGWCRQSLVFKDPEELEGWLLSEPENRHKPMSFVFQTTQTQRILEGTKKILKKLCTNVKVFDTICSATSIRQNDAANLSDLCDAIVVIGSKSSANSVHLAEICSEHCENVQFIASAKELNLSAFDKADTIGITAGASTPAWIIKEVKQTMTDEIKVEEATANKTEEETPVPEAEMSFDQMLEDSIKTIYNGDTVTGIVAAITPTEISVDLGTKHSGYIPVSEFTDDTDVSINDLVKLGDTIEACVVRVNDIEGTVMLSKKRLDAIKTWTIVEEACESGTVLEGTVTEDNRGGIVVTVKGVRVFVPASQTGLGREAEMSELLKQKVRLKITEVNRSRRRVVGSIRAVLRDERRERAEKIWSEIEVGKYYTGTVKSLTGYGAFVDIGGIDGMVHVSELSWNRIKQPDDVLSVGDVIDVYVINFDRENRKISLGYKDPDGNPWTRFVSAYNVGDVANVKIVKLMPFGAFAEVMSGVDGLIHISQISNRRIGKPD
ncbi:MAG: bifunctional 4-hydroxy-3-methylbut-2-enyl diphosphate reductase/30S ribosomal protein S1, partial [Clostridiales bacterium]|nr:bifunctional 4-hydroxy-3-methylbut-2-enyl diphosphate reductase/30S ribosomal protein S1 [Clostridiales bacterium]